MATSINTSSSGSTYITGTSSTATIDSAALIKAAVNAKLVAKTRITDQVSANTNKVAAFKLLQSQALVLKSASDKLKQDLVLDNTFESKQASYTTSDGSNAANILSASISTGAQAGQYAVTVNKLAKAFSAESDAQLSATSDLEFSGSFQIGEAGKTAATITISAGTTLQDLRTQINSSTATSGVKADILQLGNGQFKLVISGKDTAKNVTVSNITGDDVLQSLGVLTSGGAFANVTQPAQQAEVSINNSIVNSDTNTLSNVLTGLTLNLSAEAEDTVVNLTVGNNIEGAKSVLADFVTAYNNIQATINSFKLTNADGSVSEGAYLYDEILNSSLGSDLSRLITGNYGDGQYNGLHSIGITLNSSNQLEINNSALTAALQNNYDSVASVFAKTDTTIGLADKLSTLLNAYANTATGTIARTITNIQTSNISLSSKAEDIQTATDRYELQLIETYSKLEARLKQADTIKKQILAILNQKIE